MPPASAPQPHDLTFTACNRAWRLRRADMEALWDNMSAPEASPGWDSDERLPYWAELWPSSLALAQWLADHTSRISGRQCLDMGCGLGFTALVGQWLGARVTGMDYEPEALRYARLNAELNNIAGVAWVVMDWRQPTLPPHSFDYIWAGDIVYEQRFAEPVAAFLSTMLAPRGAAWLAEPGRAVFQSLPDRLCARDLVFTKVRTTPTWPLTPQAIPTPVGIWEITHAERGQGGS